MKIRRFLAGSVWCTVMLGCLPTADAAAYRLEGYEARRTAHRPFVIYHPRRIARMADEVEQILDAAAPGIAAQIGLEEMDTIRVFLVPDEKTYIRLHHGAVPEWGAAFSDPRAQIMGINTEVVLRSPRPLKVVISHELSHLLLAQRVKGIPCHRWFTEGLAMMQAKEWGYRDRMKLASAVWSGGAPDIEDLRSSFPRSADLARLAYSVSFVAVEELLRERPEDLITFTAFVRDLGNFEEAFSATFGEGTGEFATKIQVLLDERYKTAGGFIHTAPYWLGLTVLFLVAYIVKRVRSRRKLKRLEETE